MSRTVLCADADRQLCQILARALGADGIRVTAAHDADAVREAVGASTPGLLVLELDLPGCDGLTLLAELRKEGPAAAAAAILLVTVPPSASLIERARKLRVNAILLKPVALEAITSRVARLLPRAAAPRGRSGARARSASAAPLRGTLEAHPLPALLHEIHGLRASGVLRLEHGGRHKSIGLVDGRPASVRSNVPGERLGDWLLRTGRIDPATFQESIRRMRRGDGLQGQILVAMEALSPDELAEALHAHADEKLLELFEWTSGRFELALGARLDRASALDVRRSPADVIRAGVATRFPIERIDATLRHHADDVAFTSENPFYSFQEIALDEQDRRLLVAAEAGLPVAHILAASPSLRRATYALLAIELLELRDGATVRRGGPAARVRLQHGPAPAQTPDEAAPARGAPVSSAAATAEAPAPRQAAARAAAVTAEPPPILSDEDHAHYAADHGLRAALTDLLVQLRRPSPFEKLGLRPDASIAEIRAAYTELAKRAHPDRYAGANHAVRGLAEEAFREITRAYQTLADPEQLAAYRKDPLRDLKDERAVEEAQRVLLAEQEFQRGEARLRVYDWAGALAHFERAVELYPDEGEYVAYCGWAYYLTHGHAPEVFARAFEMVKRGAKLAPERDKPYLFLGRLCQAVGKLELAEKMFTRAVERKPDCTEALRELRLLAMRKPRTGLVGRLLRRAGGDRKRSSA